MRNDCPVLEVFTNTAHEMRERKKELEAHRAYVARTVRKTRKRYDSIFAIWLIPSNLRAQRRNLVLFFKVCKEYSFDPKKNKITKK